jgi:hypothetical protein
MNFLEIKQDSGIIFTLKIHFLYLFYNFLLALDCAPQYKKVRGLIYKIQGLLQIILNWVRTTGSFL